MRLLNFCFFIVICSTASSTYAQNNLSVEGTESDIAKVLYINNDMTNGSGIAIISDGYPINLNNEITKPYGGITWQRTNQTDKWDLGLISGITNSLVLWYNSILRGSFDAVSGDYTSVSDYRLKDEIENLPPVLPKILQLQAKNYYFKNDLRRSNKSIGFIAQEVQELFPTLVKSVAGSSGEETLTLNYSGFGVLAIQGLQEQQQQIDQLKEQNDLLTKQVEELMAQQKMLLNKLEIQETEN